MRRQHVAALAVASFTCLLVAGISLAANDRFALKAPNGIEFRSPSSASRWRSGSGRVRRAAKRGGLSKEFRSEPRQGASPSRRRLTSAAGGAIVARGGGQGARVGGRERAFGIPTLSAASQPQRSRSSEWISMKRNLQKWPIPVQSTMTTPSARSRRVMILTQTPHAAFGMCYPHNAMGFSHYVSIFARGVSRSGSQADIVTGGIVLRWPSTGEDVSAYRIYRKTVDAHWALLNSIESTKGHLGWYEFRDSTTAFGAAYIYGIAATDSYGNESRISESPIVTQR